MIAELTSQPKQDVGSRSATGWPWAIAAGVLASVLVTAPGYGSHLLVMLGIYLLLAYSLNLLMGFGGLIVFCHAAFYGIGAYTYALARVGGAPQGAHATDFLWIESWGFLPAVVAASMAGALMAWAIGWVCLRFRRDQFVFATLGCQMIVFMVLHNCVALTAGSTGIHGIPRPSVSGVELLEPWHYVLLFGTVCVPVLLLLFRLYRSSLGLSLKALREDERAARAMGVDTTSLMLRAMVVAGAVAGLAGALYAGYVTFIDPTSFSLRESIFLVTLLMLGGGGNIRGPMAGAVIMLTLPEVLRLAGLPNAVAANVREIIYGAILVLLMYWRPRGLAGATMIR